MARGNLQIIATALAVGIGAEAHAVILYASPERNLDPPGSLANRDPWTQPSGPDDPRRLLNSGWQYQGDFQGFLGTPVSPQYFITASHIGGSIGSQIHYNGNTYTTTAFWDHLGPDVNDLDNDNDTSELVQLSDLRIWKIDGTFPTYAPLYDASLDGSEVGKSLVVFGRGTQRGTEVRAADGTLKGWMWGAPDGARSWGENTVSGIMDYSVDGDAMLLAFDFDASGGPNEATLSIGDSGGAVFIESGGVWKLAGINYGVLNPWRLDVDGSPGAQFSAAIFDAGGLWFGGDEPVFIPDEIDDIPAFSVATRISTELSWIHSIVPLPLPTSHVPEPASFAAVLGMVFSISRRPPVKARATSRAALPS